MVAIIEKSIKSKMTIKLDLITLLALSLPNTSVIMSFMVNTRGKTSRATLPLKINIGTVLAPMSSETMTQKI